MPYYQRNMSFSFGTGLTPLGKTLLIIYASVYVLELIIHRWIHAPFVEALLIWPVFSSKFHIWQILTHPFLYNPWVSPIYFLIACLMIYFFVGPVEEAFGTKNFLIFYFISALGGLLCGMLTDVFFGSGLPFSGMWPSILSTIVIFGLLNPESTVLLMFVIPAKAKYISYITVIGTCLTIIAREPHGFYHLGGILFGYIYFKGPKNVLNMIYLKYLELKLKRKLSRLKVYDGKDKDDNDRRTYH